MPRKTKKNLRPAEMPATLFLDRDGVINKRLMDDYVKTVEEFEFLPGVIQCFPVLNKFFSKIFVVTNQQGVGKGLMDEKDLERIHDFMKTEIRNHGGKIDKIYFCPGLKEKNPFCRKPEVGMALQARKEYPEIDFKQSVMVGDTLNDMTFGHRLGMITVLTGSDFHLAQQYPDMVDHYYSSLNDFANALEYEK
jgi:D-glycero-D-manno-heptose 1,7-bisphosphate phosphatase